MIDKMIQTEAFYQVSLNNYFAALNKIVEEEGFKNVLNHPIAAVVDKKGKLMYDLDITKGYPPGLIAANLKLPYVGAVIISAGGPGIAATEENSTDDSFKEKMLAEIDKAKREGRSAVAAMKDMFEKAGFKYKAGFTGVVAVMTRNNVRERTIVFGDAGDGKTLEISFDSADGSHGITQQSVSSNIIEDVERELAK